MKNLAMAFAILLLAATNAAAGSPSVDGAYVYIVSPAHGEVVTSPFKVVFGLSGMGVAPAGIDKAKTGHHHLLVDKIIDLVINFPHFNFNKNKV